MSEEGPQYTRPENLLGALGIEFKGLSDEERTMQQLLREEYKKRQLNMLTEVQKWRADHPDATFGESVRALYERLEDEK